MANRIFLLDGMALIYRAHFALIRTPIFTSRGFNTSAIFGFTNTLLEIIQNRKPTHLAVAFDTSAPTPRHEVFPEYKAQREEMPEELSASIPHVRRILEAFHIPILTLDGYEADDIIGTLVRRIEIHDPTAEIYMVTPDKDFAQLVTEHVRILKPGRQGSDAEILGLEEIRENWEVERPEQVIDILGLWGDASDNIPGVPGVGEKTAKKLISQFGSVENLIANAAQVPGKMREKIEQHADQARLSRQLATIIVDAPVVLDLSTLTLDEPNADALKSLFVQFEFNALGKRMFGEDFKAGRGHIKPLAPGETLEAATVVPDLKTIQDVKVDYRQVRTPAERAELIQNLGRQKSFALDLELTERDPRRAKIAGISFCWHAGQGFYQELPPNDLPAQRRILEEFKPVLENSGIEKIGHDLKFLLTVLFWHDTTVKGPFFDTMLVHTLLQPDQRHTIQYLSEAVLGYEVGRLPENVDDEPPSEQLDMLDLLDKQPEEVVRRRSEATDVAWQIAEKLRPQLKDLGQDRVYFEVEGPLIPVLARMEREGVAVNTGALGQISAVLTAHMNTLERKIYAAAGQEFNLNSPRQLGEILFEQMKLIEKPKKTKTGQYKTDEAVLAALAVEHEIVADIMAYREASKLKSTYVDALPQAVLPRSGRVHTQFDQLLAATGRLASTNPNLQNIPIRTEMGREIRTAFVPAGPDFCILSADYSQIELRVMASLSGDPAMLEAFQKGDDIHASTAARVYGVKMDEVLPEMRRTAKMVNFGIIYGISGFGLAQRLGIPRKEAEVIIEEYFKNYPLVKKYMDDTIVFAQQHGYVETLTGRRRYLRDINSRNWNIRGAAERTAINTPVQGSAADLIKLAMIQIDERLTPDQYRSRMTLQVHDELVFDLYKPEQEEVIGIVTEAMKTALPLNVPIVVDYGMGENWLEAH